MQNLKFAFSSIMAHKMRSLLTMIGIIIGVSSVVVIMALGDSLSRQVNKDMTKSQKNISVFFSPKKSKMGLLLRNNQLLRFLERKRKFLLNRQNRKNPGSKRQLN